MCVPVDRMQEIITEGRYAIAGILGRGSVGTVYRARDRVLERDVALKVLRKPYAGTGRIAEHFRQGVKDAASLSHPNIVAIYDSIEPEESISYIAMQYVGGGTLAGRLAEEAPLGADETARIALEVADALDEGHRRGISHKNLHSRNVLLTEEGQAKVADFGFASAAENIEKYPLDHGSGATSSSGREGDLHALGALLYEMLTGDADIHPERLRPSEKNPLVPEELDALTLALLAADPAARPSAAQAHERLKLFLGSAVASAPEEAPVDEPGKPGSRVRERVAMAGSTFRTQWRLAAVLVCASLVLAGLAVLGTPIYGFGGGSAKKPLASVLEPRAADAEMPDRGAATRPADDGDERATENSRDEKDAPEERDSPRKDPDEPSSGHLEPDDPAPAANTPAAIASTSTTSASTASVDTTSVDTASASTASTNTASASAASASAASTSAASASTASASAAPAPRTAESSASAAPAPAPWASAGSVAPVGPQPSPPSSRSATAEPAPEPVKIPRPAPVARQPVQPTPDPASEPTPEPAPEAQPDDPDELVIPELDVPEVRIEPGLSTPPPGRAATQ